jgi:hypothetical protein
MPGSTARKKFPDVVWAYESVWQDAHSDRKAQSSAM